MIDLLWHTPTGRHRPPRHADRRRGRARHHRHAGGARAQAPAAAARQQQGALQGRLRGRHGPHRPRVLPRRAQVHRAPAAGGQHPLRQRAHRELQRQEADGASRLHRGAGGARRAADAGAGLSADRRPVGQGAAQGGARRRSSGCPTCPSGRSRPGSRQRGWPDVKTALARLHRPQEAADVSAGSPPWQRLAYDELLAGQLALALVRQSFKQQPGRSVVRRRPHPRAASPTRCPSR